jgi:hypothetical protein
LSNFDGKVAGRGIRLVAGSRFTLERDLHVLSWG